METYIFHKLKIYTSRDTKKYPFLLDQTLFIIKYCIFTELRLIYSDTEIYKFTERCLTRLFKKIGFTLVQTFHKFLK